MRNIVKVFHAWFAAPPRPEPRRSKNLSRQDVVVLMANKKLSSAQAKVVISKRFGD